MINICSIDWDYFFPNSIFYDWGHNENFPDMLWNIRADNIPILNKKYNEKDIALHNYIPDQNKLKDFWNNIKIKENLNLIITESHLDISYIFDSILLYDEISIYNFDAHHDIYSSEEELDCGNWAYHFLNSDESITHYHIIYPEWRKTEPDMKIDMKIDINTHYQIPDNLPIFDILFICRSGAWTPSWADDDWINFIECWKQKSSSIWDNKIALDYVLKKRDFKYEQFRKLKVEDLENK